LTIDSDTSITAHYSYKGEVVRSEDSTSGLFDVNGEEVSIAAENGAITVQNTSAGDTVTIYMMNGMKVGSWGTTQYKQVISVRPSVYLVHFLQR